MKLEKYKLRFNAAQTAFEFISEGPKGNILKGVYYSKVAVKGFKNIYNLAFGDKILDSGDIDDLIVTNNQDHEKILATVAYTVIVFTKRHPKAQIIIQGSNSARTRLYQIAISKYFEEISEIFDIQGLINDELFDINLKLSKLLQEADTFYNKNILPNINSLTTVDYDNLKKFANTLFCTSSSQKCVLFSNSSVSLSHSY